MGSIGPGEVLLIVATATVWIVPVALIALGLRWLMRRGTGPGDPALDVLRQRYARGEIDAAEYEDRKRTLGS